MKPTRTTLLALTAAAVLASPPTARSQPAEEPPAEAADAGGTPAATDYVEALNLHFEAADEPEGWFAGGEGYAAAIDHEVKHAGRRSLRIAFEEAGGFGVATATFPVADARGKKLRYAGYLKSLDLDEGWTGLWMRVDGPDGPVAFDNMEQHGVKGTTDWTRYEIALDVPEDAVNINFGVINGGNGTIWLDTLSFELTGPDPPPQVVLLRGTVLDPDGRPVAGARVALTQVMTSYAVGRDRSGEDGRFAFEALPGYYGLTATAPGHAAAFAGVAPRAADQPLTATLSREGFTVSGRVTDEDGRAVADAALRFDRLSSDQGDLFYTETDGEGRYSVKLIPGEIYSVGLDSQDHVAAGRTIAAVDQTLDLRAARRGAAPGEVVSWIREHSVPLATAVAGSGFDDMKPLAAVIGEARVVGLGEATHGSREFFQIKHRFLEFLVEEMGFTVFAIEAAFAESLAVNDYVLHGKGDPGEALAGLHFWTWNTQEVLALIEWMRRYNADPEHGKKVKFYGIDMQSTMAASREALAYLARVDEEYARQIRLEPLDQQRSETAFNELGEDRRRALKETVDALLARLDAERERYVGAAGESAWVLGRRHVVVLEQAIEMFEAPFYFNARDAAMAANLEWILDVEPPGTRMVLWAHNAHLSRYDAGAIRQMGFHVARAMANDYVVFGFAFNRGAFQAIDLTTGLPGLRRVTVGPAPEGNLGAELARAQMPMLVLDLRRLAAGPVASWFGSPLPMRSLGATFVGEEYMSRGIVPARSFDAVIFVDETTRAEPVGR